MLVTPPYDKNIHKKKNNNKLKKYSIYWNMVSGKRNFFQKKKATLD